MDNLTEALFYKTNNALHREWMAKRNPEYVACNPADYDDLRYRRFMLSVFVVADEQVGVGEVLVCDRPAAFVRGYSEIP